MTSNENDLIALLRRVLADGAYGLTLRGGKLPVLHSEMGSHSIEGISPTPEDVLLFLRQVSKSREMRELRERGVVSFMHTLETGIRLLVGARMEKDTICVELRRMTGQQSDGANVELDAPRSSS